VVRARRQAGVLGGHPVALDHRVLAQALGDVRPPEADAVGDRQAGQIDLRILGHLEAQRDVQRRAQARAALRLLDHDLRRATCGRRHRRFGWRHAAEQLALGSGAGILLRRDKIEALGGRRDKGGGHGKDGGEGESCRCSSRVPLGHSSAPWRHRAGVPSHKRNGAASPHAVKPLAPPLLAEEVQGVPDNLTEKVKKAKRARRELVV
jgi:hypothetical protein